MTLSISGVGAAVDSSAIAVIGSLASLLLVLIWVTVALRTVGLVRSAAAR
jgi:hypothetical protein